jgi:ABC-type phosphate transport system substrate-binding protein
MGGDKIKLTDSRLTKRLSLIACVGSLWAASLLGPSQGLTNAAPAPAPAPTLINGAGATFPQPLYIKWFEKYHMLQPEIEFNYQGVGSGVGIQQRINKTVDFGASDGPMSDPQLAEAHPEPVELSRWDTECASGMLKETPAGRYRLRKVDLRQPN